MKIILIVTLLMFTVVPTAHVELMASQLGQGAQKTEPLPKGYVTKDGKRYGSCKNHHHRRHKHCKVRVEAMPGSKTKDIQ